MCCRCNLGLGYVVIRERLEITLNIEYNAFIHFGGAKIEEVVEPTSTWIDNLKTKTYDS